MPFGLICDCILAGRGLLVLSLARMWTVGVFLCWVVDCGDLFQLGCDCLQPLGLVHDYVKSARECLTVFGVEYHC